MRLPLDAVYPDGTVSRSSSPTAPPLKPRGSSMAESSPITRAMIAAGARAHDPDTLRRAGRTEPAVVGIMNGREPSPVPREAARITLSAALATGATRS